MAASTVSAPGATRPRLPRRLAKVKFEFQRPELDDVGPCLLSSVSFQTARKHLDSCVSSFFCDEPHL